MSVLLVSVIVAAAVLTSWALILAVYAGWLARLWREPVLRWPVAVIESDDWGPGPSGHVAALEEVIATLERNRDVTGRGATMTIGAILAVPDNRAIREQGFHRYVRQTLVSPRFDAMRRTLISGRDRGVLALQLHGLEHLWPAALLEWAKQDEHVREWILLSQGFDTEALPAPVQTRWTDVATLPSRDLPPGAIRTAVCDEVEAFGRCFGESARVAVPPTFVWNSAVERAWAKGGVRAVITPGRRLTIRDGKGVAGGRDKVILNGELGESGLVYLVRDIYFEPTLGHTAEATLVQICSRNRLGRPALLETHRFNFVADQTSRERALGELDRLLRYLLKRFPLLRFVSSAELAAAFAQRDPEWVEARFVVRLLVWLRRVAAIHRLRKLAWVTGLVIPAGLLYGGAKFLLAAGDNREPGPSHD